MTPWSVRRRLPARHRGAPGGGPASRRPDLDGLRGLAAVFVVSHHMALDTLHLPTGGHIGVVVFFTLSGYLITRLLWCARPAAPRGAYVAFVQRRIVRLGPALVAVVVLGTLLHLWVGGTTLRSASMTAALALSQLFAVQKSLHPGVQSPLDPTWSLTVEWWFYLGWPVLLIWLRHTGRSARLARVVALGLAACLYLSALPLPPAAFYFSPSANLAPMLCGAAVALTPRASTLPGPRGARSGLVAMGSLVLLILLALGPMTCGALLYRAAVVPLVTVASGMLLRAPAAGAGASTALSWRPLRAVGVRAYSLYLWHLPALWLVGHLFPSVPGWARAIAAVALLLPLVQLSFTLLERPALDGRPWWPRPRARSQPAGTTTSEALASTTQPLPARVSA